MLALRELIDAGALLVENSGFKKVGVLGALRTIDSRIYSKRLSAKGIKVVERAAQPLSALIEAGEISGARISSTLEQILKPMEGVQGLLLACTHFPAISKEIQKALPGPRLLDPAEGVARHVIKIIGTDSFEGKDEFYTTGNAEQTRISAFKAFQVICDPVRIDI